MHKLLLLILSYFFFVTTSFSQSLLVSYVSGDCVKCQIILESVLRKNTNKIPLFYVFPKLYEADSTEIRTSNNFKESDILVFSDTYSKLIEAESVSVAYLSSNNTIVFKKSVLELKPTDAQLLDSLYANDFFYKTKKPLIERFKDGWKITKNQVTSSITIDSLNVVKKVAINDDIESKAKISVEQVNPRFFKLTNDAIADSAIPNSFLKPSIVDHFFTNGALYYHITIPYIAPPTKEEIEMGAKGGIDKCHVIAVEKMGTETKFYPIPNVSFGRGELSSRPSFIINENSLYCFEYYTDSARENVDRRYITEYTLDSTYHLNAFNISEGKIEFLHSINLNSFGLDFAEYPVIFYDKLNKLFYYENQDGYIHSIPLVLIST